MMVGLALMMVLIGQTGGGLDSRLFYGVAAVAAVAAALNLAVMISGRLALRRVVDASV